MQRLGPKDDVYSDGVTKITDPFYCCLCRKCLHRFWSAALLPHCSKCLSKDIFFSHDWDSVAEEMKRIRNLSE